MYGGAGKEMGHKRVMGVERREQKVGNTEHRVGR